MLVHPFVSNLSRAVSLHLSRSESTQSGHGAVSERSAESTQRAFSHQNKSHIVEACKFFVLLVLD